MICNSVFIEVSQKVLRLIYSWTILNQLKSKIKQEEYDKHKIK